MDRRDLGIVASPAIPIRATYACNDAGMTSDLVLDNALAFKVR